MNIAKLLNYVEKIGDKGIPITKLSTNTRYLEKVIGTLRKYDLIEIHGNRYKLVYLSERGLKIYNILKQIELILKENGEINLEKISDKNFISKKEYIPEILEKSPSFLVDNPWIAVLSKRGRENA